MTKLSEYGPYSTASVTTLRVPPVLVASVQGEEEHGPPPGTVLVSVRKEGNTPPCMKPLVIRLTVPVHRASPERARRYAIMGGGVGGGADAFVTVKVRARISVIELGLGLGLGPRLEKRARVRG